MAVSGKVLGVSAINLWNNTLVNNTTYFSVSTSPTIPFTYTVNAGTIDTPIPDKPYQMNPDGITDPSSRDIYYHTTGPTQLTSPPAPTTLIVRIYYETGTGILVKEIFNGVPPASGTKIATVFATDTTLVGGNKRAGTLRLWFNVILTGTVGGLNDYNATSDDTTDGSSGTSVIRGQAFQGILRSNATISAIGVNAYPVGATFAYGSAGNETVTLTATHTQKYAATGTETVSLDVIDSSDAQKIAGAVRAIDAVSSYIQSQVAASLFSNSSAIYGARFIPVGNSALVPTSGAILWTKFVASGVVQDGVSVKRASFYNVDPRITMPTATSGKALYNRGQPSTISIVLKNARNESLTRSIVFQLRDSLAAVKQATSYTGTPFNVAYTIGAADDAAADLIGKQWTVNVNQADVTTNPSANAFKVSSLYQVDAHTQKLPTLNPDPIGANQNLNEDFGFVILGDVMNSWGHVTDASGAAINTAAGNNVTVTIKTPDGSTAQTYQTDTKQDPTNNNTDGWTPRIAFNPTAPAGNWSITAAVAYNGNSGTDSQTVTFITPLTSNLETLLRGPVLMKPGQTFRCTYQTQVDDVSAIPQVVPVWQLYKVTAGVLVPVAAPVSMFNSVDATQTVNGADYYFDIIPPTVEDRYIVFTKAQLNGNGIRRSQAFRVADNDANFTGIPFAGPN